MGENKDLYSSNKSNKNMEINIPPNLNPKQIICFNELVKPQLEELYSYNYDKFEFKNINIFMAKDKFPNNIKKPDIKEIKNFLSKISEKHLKFVSNIYLVSYHCKDDNHKEVKGRTLPIIYKIIIYPKVGNRLNIILAHEIGHIVFEKYYTLRIRSDFASVLFQTFPNARFNSINGYDQFIKEQYANCYDNFINNPKRLKKEFPYIYNHFINDD